MLVALIVIAALAAGFGACGAALFFRPHLLRPHLLTTQLAGEPIASRVGAVLSTVAHATDIGTSVAAALTNPGRIVVTAGARELLGFSISETAAGTAEARIHDGTSSAAPLRAVLTFAASGSADTFFSDQGVEILSGSIFVEVVSGSIRGVLYWG